MAILIDLNQVLISNLMQQINSNPRTQLDEGLIRHMVMNSLRSYNRQFKEKFGDMIICCDSRTFWRRDYFPFYKAHRKKDRDKSEFNWTLIFETLNKIREELKEFFPYKVIEVHYAEADDIIAVLAGRLSPHGPVLILSSDKDFVQLQKYANVTQYSPILKRYIKADDPLAYVKEHVLKGDRGDGIPNFLSADSVFAVGERQKTINSKKLTEWMTKSPEEFCLTDVMKHGYQRNQKLIDFEYIPEDIKTAVVEAFDNTKPQSRQKLLTYFTQYRLAKLITDLQDF